MRGLLFLFGCYLGRYLSVYLQFVENLFRLIDPNNNGRVSLSELMDSLEKLTV